MMTSLFSAAQRRCCGANLVSRLLFVVVAVWIADSRASADEAPDFEGEIAPLLIRRCVECHRGADPSGGLDLTSRQGLIAGGKKGPAVDLQRPRASRILDRVNAGEMPPEKQGRSQRLPDEEIEVLRRWVEAGAPWPEERELDYFERTNELRAGRDWWSLQPIERPEVPATSAGGEVSRNPVDAFVMAAYEDYDIEPAPIADRETLIRRLYFATLGLPPSPEEIAAFVNDALPGAWSRLVDQLLERPQYGERWARYWLDVARYADTSGYERDQEKLFAWKYRDWVVDALNEDMSYTTFITHQLAGDEIENPTESSVVATGFLRLGAWNDEPNDPEDYQYERLEDLVHTTSSAFIGLTVKCARCHGHKFDPITQEDYYRMASVFWTGPVAPGRSRDALGGPTTEELGFEEILGWTDVRPEAALHVLKNGERHQPLYPVTPASLSFAPRLERVFPATAEGAKTSGRRLALAEWITDRDHPLTARVWVNRLWQGAMGKGIVRTPNNFGFLADPPTHPELLDWLASEFIANGGHSKPILRWIFNSDTWKRASTHPEAERLVTVDPGNRLWLRAERRRLDAEALRDALLVASGEIDLSMGGASFRPTVSSEALEGLSQKDAAWTASPKSEQNRRSLYMYMKRGLLPPMMTTFDLCDPTLSAGKRNVTLAPTQALALMNHPFVHGRSLHLASDIMARISRLEDQIEEAWKRVLARAPTLEEARLSETHVRSQRDRFAAQRLEIETESNEAPSQTDDSLGFWMRAGSAELAETNGVRVVRVPDLSESGHDLVQMESAAQPEFVASAFGGRPSLKFDGNGRFMEILGTLLDSSEYTFVCVASDDANSGHREIISNWDGSEGNSTSSVFLGLTGENTVRFSDAFSNAGSVVKRRDPFILSAVNGENAVAVYQNGAIIGKGPPLAGRRLDTRWVVGQQGDINGEFWTGRIAEIRVYDRALSGRERLRVEEELAAFYNIAMSADDSEESPPDSDVLALASLCHTLMNSNEFMYVD